MATLDRQWKALVRQLERIAAETRRARGEARVRLRALESRTRATVEQALRRAEPRVREAVNEASRVGRGLRAGVRAGAEAYKSSRRQK